MRRSLIATHRRVGSSHRAGQKNASQTAAGDSRSRCLQPSCSEASNFHPVRGGTTMSWKPRNTIAIHQRPSGRRVGYRPRLEWLEERATPSTLPPGFAEAQVTSGLSSPTAMDFSPTGELWVLEQGGRVKLVRSDGTTF